MKLIIGNKAYSSWSLRGWLACKHSGLGFEEILVPLYSDDWEERKQAGDLAPSHGKVPILWDGETVIWDSIAILDWLSDKAQGPRFWPADDVARGMARAMAAEMHCSYAALRRECPMNTRKLFPDAAISEEAREDAIRILQLWAQARARFGKSGPFLFGTFGAADIMFAPVVSRFRTYGFKLPGFAQAYSESILEHQWMRDWYAAAEDEPWFIDSYEEARTSEV